MDFPDFSALAGKSAPSPVAHPNVICEQVIEHSWVEGLSHCELVAKVLRCRATFPKRRCWIAHLFRVCRFYSSLFGQFLGKVNLMMWIHFDTISHGLHIFSRTVRCVFAIFMQNIFSCISSQIVRCLCPGPNITFLFCYCCLYARCHVSSQPCINATDFAAHVAFRRSIDASRSVHGISGRCV